MKILKTDLNGKNGIELAEDKEYIIGNRNNTLVFFLYGKDNQPFELVVDLEDAEVMTDALIDFRRDAGQKI